MTKKYLVTNQFVDKTTGLVVLPGGEYEADEERAKRLQAADVIGAEIAPVEVVKKGAAAAKKEADIDDVTTAE